MLEIYRNRLAAASVAIPLSLASFGCSTNPEPLEQQAKKVSIDRTEGVFEIQSIDRIVVAECLKDIAATRNIDDVIRTGYENSTANGNGFVVMTSNLKQSPQIVKIIDSIDAASLAIGLKELREQYGQDSISNVVRAGYSTSSANSNGFVIVVNQANK